jgi:hypothetical protein
LEEKPRLKGLIKHPVVVYKNYFLSFALKDNLDKEEGVLSKIIESIPFLTDDILNGKDELIKDSQIGNYYFTRLVNQAFERGLLARKLKSYKLSKGFCYFFDEVLLKDGRVNYRNNNEIDPRIKLWGKFKNESWHWAVRANVMMEPELHYLIQPHVLVRNKKEIRSAPKGAYKSWRNDKWRDKLRATVIHLSEDNDIIRFEVGAQEVLQASRDSIQYVSPFSFEEPAEQYEIDEEDIVD